MLIYIVSFFHFLRITRKTRQLLLKIAFLMLCTICFHHEKKSLWLQPLRLMTLWIVQVFLCRNSAILLQFLIYILIEQVRDCTWRWLKVNTKYLHFLNVLIMESSASIRNWPFPGSPFFCFRLLFTFWLVFRLEKLDLNTPHSCSINLWDSVLLQLIV